MPPPLSLLHIVPHAGGGVGAVVRSLLAADWGVEMVHSLASLDTLNQATRSWCEGLGTAWRDELAAQPSSELAMLVESADLVIVHWWNHPYLMRLLYEGIPACRMLIWSHVNGAHVPQAFIPELFSLPDRFVFSCHASGEGPVAAELPGEDRARLRTIRSSCGIPKGMDAEAIKEGSFQAGYVGTVEAVKMHADFLKVCAQADLPTPVVVAGGPDHDALARQAERMNAAGRFDILGPVADPVPLYRRLHALAYPLARTHYGTGEQVLIEAMAHGAVPVVLDNPPETEVVRHRETGLVASSSQDFTEALHWLMENPEERERMAVQGRRFVINECGIEHSVSSFIRLFDEVRDMPRRTRRLCLPDLPGVDAGSASHLFLSSFGGTDLQERLRTAGGLAPHEAQAIRSPTRGSPFHYVSLLGSDPLLDEICGVVLNGEEG